MKSIKLKHWRSIKIKHMMWANRVVITSTIQFNPQVIEVLQLFHAVSEFQCSNVEGPITLLLATRSWNMQQKFISGKEIILLLHFGLLVAYSTLTETLQGTLHYNSQVWLLRKHGWLSISWLLAGYSKTGFDHAINLLLKIQFGIKKNTQISSIWMDVVYNGPQKTRKQWRRTQRAK